MSNISKVVLLHWQTSTFLSLLVSKFCELPSRRLQETDRVYTHHIGRLPESSSQLEMFAQFAPYLLFVSAFICKFCVQAEDAAAVVAGVRSSGGFDTAAAFVITTGDDCVPRIVQSGQEVTGPIQLTSGEGAIIEICTSGGEHYFTYVSSSS
jgi:hypothetical protein